MGCVSVRPVKFSSLAGIALSSWIRGTLERTDQGPPENLEDWRHKGQVSGSEGIVRVVSREELSFNCEKTWILAEQCSN